MLATFEETLNHAISKYKEEFGKEPEIASCAPGRVNLIGEHVDYNDGFVLPMALPMVTIIVGSKNHTTSIAEIRTCTKEADLPHIDKFDCTNLSPDSFPPKWSNYVKGVIKYFGHPIPGFNAVIASNVPVGGGLSSSAALEVSALTFLEQLTGKYIESNSEKALICQKAEHIFAGMPCGIMDQFISVAGKKSNVLLIDCKSLETFQIPFVTNDLVVLICNSNVAHKLADSEYSMRRQQCTRALKIMGLKTFRDATVNHLSALTNLAFDKNYTLCKRARHVITEIERTQEASEALRQHDFERLGKLMTNSHISLRDDFQVSCFELDVLVDSAINCSGVLGSRMTGGGFGGCTVTLLRKDAVENVMKEMQKDFQEKCSNKDIHKNNNSNNNNNNNNNDNNNDNDNDKSNENEQQQQYKVDFYVCEPCDGARVLKI